MNDLPNSQSVGGSPIQTVPAQSTDLIKAAGSVIGASGKEKEVGGSARIELPIQDLGKEIELPHEVAQSGVSVKPTVISIPKPVSSMGVTPAGVNVVPTTNVRPVPLTDDQIAQGLHQSILSSWRWLAEWCVRKLKQIGVKK